MTLPRLAYLTGEYPRASDTFIQREVAALRALGHEVMTCSIRRTGAEHLVGPEQRAEHSRTFNVLQAAKNPLRLILAHLRLLRRPDRYVASIWLAIRTAPPGIRASLYQLLYFLEAGVLATTLNREGVDHLHNHIAKASCTVAMLASRLSGIPFSFTIHGPDIFFEPHYWRIDVKSHEAAFVSCISHFCRSQLMSFASVQDWSKLHIIHCGVDPSRYATPPEHTGKQVLFVGRLGAVKGVLIALQAVAKLRHTHPDIHLTLIGDGPDRHDLETQAKALGIEAQTSFLGYRSQSEVAKALSSTDVFVLPSFAEGVPVVLMEAMAAQVPVLTTRIAGVPELVEDGTSGLLVSPGDPEAFAAALDDLLKQPALRRAMGAEGRKKVVADFDIVTEAAKLSALFCKSRIRDTDLSDRKASP